jgi:hypothetical protein
MCGDIVETPTPTPAPAPKPTPFLPARLFLLFFFLAIVIAGLDGSALSPLETNESPAIPSTIAFASLSSDRPAAATPLALPLAVAVAVAVAVAALAGGDCSDNGGVGVASTIRGTST